jgi:hypothetical protein
VKNIHQIRHSNSWNKKIPRTGESDFLDSYYKFLHLIYMFRIIETSQVQFILKYTQKRTVQNFLHAMKSLGYIGNERVGNSHYWYLTQSGASRIGKEIPEEVHTLKSVKRNSLVIDAAVTFLQNTNDGTTGLVDIVSNDKFSTVEYILGEGTAKLCIVADVGKQIDIELDDPTLPVAFITELDHTRSWSIVQAFTDSGFSVISTTREAIKSFGPYSEIWATVFDLTKYAILANFPVTTHKDQKPCIGSSEWLKNLV